MRGVERREPAAEREHPAVTEHGEGQDGTGGEDEEDHAIEISSKEATHQELLEKIQMDFRECLTDKDMKLASLSQQLSDNSLKSSAKIKELNSQIQSLISKMHIKDNDLNGNVNAQVQRGDMLEAELNDMQLSIDEMRLTIVNLNTEKNAAISTISKNAVQYQKAEKELTARIDELKNELETKKAELEITAGL